MQMIFNFDVFCLCCVLIKTYFYAIIDEKIAWSFSWSLHALSKKRSLFGQSWWMDEWLFGSLKFNRANQFDIVVFETARHRFNIYASSQGRNQGGVGLRGLKPPPP